MSVLEEATGYKNFVYFTEELESHCHSSDEMMDLSLLHLIRNAFHYRTLSLSHYSDQRFNYVKIVGNLSSSEITEKYLRGFQKRDPYAAHIGRLTLEDPRVNMIQSSEAFPVDYFNSEYHQFLRRYGMWWALTIPVGDYRLTLYKHENESDFDHAEKEKLQLMGTMLRSRFNATQQMREVRAAAEAQSYLLDSLEIGMVNANNKMAVLNCNQTASTLLRNIGNGNIQHGFDQLCVMLRNSGSRQQGINPSLSLDYQGHAITMEATKGRTEAERVYSVTILRNSGPNCRRLQGASLPEDVMSALNLTGREREVGQMLISGKSYQETADSLFISLNTVRTHVRNIYKKTGIKNQRMLSALLHG